MGVILLGKGRSGFLVLSLIFVCIFCQYNVSGKRSPSDYEKLLGEDTRGLAAEGEGRVEVGRPRKMFPVDWTTSKYSTTDLDCDHAYFIPEKGFIRFYLKSKRKECKISFLGSKEQKCKAAMLCQDIVKFDQVDCSKEYLHLTDGSEGKLIGCGWFTFMQKPRVPRNGGTDLHLIFKGESLDSLCVMFCRQDVSDEHIKSGIKNPVKLTKDILQTPPQFDNCRCGKMTANMGRVVGGQTAQRFEFPWLGFLAFNQQPKYERNVFCAAALISDTHAISAAHCFVKQHVEPWEIDFVLHAHIVDKKVGTENRDDLNEIPGWDLPKATDNDENSLRIKIKEIINHPLFIPRSDFDFDIAILKFTERLDLTKGIVSPICLPWLNETIKIEPQSQLLVSGWGRPWERAAAGARILQKLNLPFVDHKTCEKIGIKRTHRHLCVGYVEGEKDTCTGDSGGPLVKFLEKGDAFLAGVVSSGIGCARRNQLGLYSNVQELLSWITYHVTPDNAKWCPR